MASAVEYLREKGVPALIDEAVEQMIHERPADPSLFFMKYFQNLVEQSKPVFLKGMKVKVHGMAVDKALNDKVGEVKGKQDEVLVFIPGHGLRGISARNIRPLNGNLHVQPGDEVEIVGMALDKALNGLHARVRGFTTKVFCQFPEPHGARALATSNLTIVEEDNPQGASGSDFEKGDIVEVQNMAIDTALNGVRGKVKSREDLVVVSLGDRGVRTLRPVNLTFEGKIEPGKEVVIKGMSIDKSLNGFKGVVKKINTTVHVVLDDPHGRRSLPVSAVKLVEKTQASA